MTTVNLFDQNFSHSTSYYGFDSSSLTKPKKMNWVRNLSPWDGVTVFTDYMCDPKLVCSIESKKKIAWLMEPPGLSGAHSKIVDSIQYFHEIFDLVFSYHDFRTLKIPEEKWRWVPFGGAWVNPQIDPKKEYLCSIIASEKNFMNGHKLRHEIASQNYGKIDLLGSGYKKIERKEDGHTSYAFSIVVENEKYPTYFTEKLIDCLLCKSVPIYWGASRIGDIFNPDGIIQFENAAEAKSVIDFLSFEKFESMRDAINQNFEIAQKFMSTDDIIATIIEEEFAR